MSLARVLSTTADPGTATWSNLLSDYLAATATAIPVLSSQSVRLVTVAAGETNTLAAPTFPGQLMQITVSAFTGGSTRIITSAVAITAAGLTIMTFNALGDSIILAAVPVGATYRWGVQSNDGVVLS